jgi:outer membrane protein OmpA-like peptidoglycan-associated protein
MNQMVINDINCNTTVNPKSFFQTLSLLPRSIDPILVCFLFVVLSFSKLYSQESVVDSSLLVPSTPVLSKKQEITSQDKIKQSPYLYVGGYAGYVNNIFTADFASLDALTCNPNFKNGTGGGFAGGILAELPLLSMLRLEGRLGFATLGGRLFLTERIGNTAERGVGGSGSQVVEVEASHEIFSTLNAITFEPAVNTILFNKLRASVGFRIAYLMTSDYRYVETLVTDRVTYSTGSRTRNPIEGQIPEVNKLQMAMSVGVGIDFPVGSKSTLTPEIRYYAPLNTISSKEWRVASLQLGASFHYALYPPPPPIFIRDTVIQRDTVLKQLFTAGNEGLTMLDSKMDTQIRSEFAGRQETRYETTTIKENYEKRVLKIAELAVTVNAVPVGTDVSQATKDAFYGFTVEETELEENFPLLPQVFFPEGIGELNASSMNLLTREETPNFIETELPRNTLGVYRHLLNIIGKRMNERQQAKLSLVGTNSNVNAEKNNRELSLRRAESVKNYLVSSWGIEPSRITVKAVNLPTAPANNTTTEGQEENRRVEIYTDDYEILEPIAIRDVTVQSRPTSIEVSSIVKSEVGVRNWALSIEQDGNVLRKLAGDDTPDNYTWNITERPYPKSEKPVVAKYTITDKSGQTKTGVKEVSVKQLTVRQKRYEQKDDKRNDKFSLIVFDFNKADLNPDNKRIVQEVRSRIQPESKVVIAGYADKSGEPTYNRELARRRCVEVQKSVGLNDGNSTIQPYGSDTLLFDNSTPEGRSYSRTVVIEIETPVK